MVNKDTYTIVGVPYFEGEPNEVLINCLKQIDICLGKLFDVESEVIIGFNGPITSKGKLPDLSFYDKSQFNSKITFITTPPGIVSSEIEMAKIAIKRGCKRMFITDADISHFPNAFYNLWYKGNKPLIGSNHSSYPFKILKGAGIRFTADELRLMQIFEADKDPLIRDYTQPYRPNKRLKTSQILVNPSLLLDMYAKQDIGAGCQMNRHITHKNKQIVSEACFMHYARTDINDHIAARLRHFRAAYVEGVLEKFTQKSLVYKPQTADVIAALVRSKYPEAKEVPSNFLMQCALRYHVAQICTAIIKKDRRLNNKRLPLKYQGELNNTVYTFKEAYEVVKQLICCSLDLNILNQPIAKGRAITQINHRNPINIQPFLEESRYRRLICQWLNIADNANI